MFNPDFNEKFQAFCNALQSGYLKTSMAFSIQRTLTNIPAIMQDDQRLAHYIERVLEAEGFKKTDMPAICDFIKTSFQKPSPI